MLGHHRHAGETPFNETPFTLAGRCWPAYGGIWILSLKECCQSCTPLYRTFWIRCLKKFGADTALTKVGTLFQRPRLTTQKQTPWNGTLVPPTSESGLHLIHGVYKQTLWRHNVRPGTVLICLTIYTDATQWWQLLWLPPQRSGPTE